MKINYVLLYGTPYLRYELFDTFKKMSDFIVKRSIVNYSIFKKLEDKEEVEMIYRDNDIRVLEKELKDLQFSHDSLYEQNEKYKTRIIKAIEYIKSNEKEYGSLEDNEKIILDILRGENNE